jgi:type II secretory pathway pseudopilin PulG
MKFLIKNKIYFSAFTLIEALVAISILIIGIISSFSLINHALYNANVIEDRLTAVYLAQEGLELVREIRDSNYVKWLNDVSNVKWNDNLTPGESIISFGDKKLNPITNNSIPYLYYHEDKGIYDYDSSGGAKLTSFKRIITITEGGKADSGDLYELIVTVKMQWQTRGINYSFEIEDHLFNWLSV